MGIVGFFIVWLPRAIAFIIMYCKEGTEVTRWSLVYVQALTTIIAFCCFIITAMVAKGEKTKE